LNTYSLKFDDPEVEVSYQDSVAPARRWQMRLGLLMPAVLYVIFGFLDPLVLPGSVASQAQHIHIAQGIVFTSLVALSLRIESMNYHTGMVAGAVLVAWTSHLYLSSLGGAEELAGEAYLMIIWMWLVSGLNMVQAARVMLAFVAIFLAFRPLTDIAATFLPLYLFFLLAATLFGSIAGYLSEYYRRQGFLSEEKRRKMEEQFIQAQKMEAIGTLVGGIAHDFNNTLAVITGNIFLAKQGLKEQVSALRMLETVEKASFRSAEIIKQLLAFSRKGFVQMQDMDASSLLDTTAHLYRVSVPVSTRFTYRNLLRSSVAIHGDVNQLEQVLFNLLNNAQDAVADTSSPAIELQIDEWSADEQFRQQHPTLQTRQFVRIAVSDNGRGIDGVNLGHIFEPFFSTKTEGTGLGLSMVFGTIQTHGGVVTVESSPGQGSTFRLYLPVLKQPLAEAVSVAGEVEEAVEGGTILIADDNENVLQVTAQLLTNLGYKVLQATDGGEAVKLYGQHSERIGLVLLDIVMPQMGGGEAAKLIRQTNPAVKIIYLTGYDPDASTISGLNAPIIMKPFNVTEFSHRIRLAMES